ncbi:hypothetical protein C8Q80DRAFT_1276624 [Daedaleopsis nitida]|nr:hypothetical protein C8Q80DRAFT_1276624 [Daedaleopsis nitida]
MRINQDVADHIIDCLEDDLQTLSACALVCKHWRRRARRHLFAEVTLAFPSESRRKLFDDLIGHDPDICRHVKALCLSAKRWQAIPWPGDGLLQKYANMSMLRYFTISGFSCTSLAQVAKTAICSFPVLEILIFDQVTARGDTSGAPQTGWQPTEYPIDIHRTAARARPLKVLVLNDLSGRRDVREHQSFALAQVLEEMGELSTLTKLSLLGDSASTHVWIPFLPAIGPTLEHCAVTVNDVVVSGDDVNIGFSKQQLRDRITNLYNALLGCPSLRSLRIKYDGFPTFIREVVHNRVSPSPIIAPFFLDALASLLSSSRTAGLAAAGTTLPDSPAASPSQTVGESPFPHLETLRLDLVCNVESLSQCGGAWAGLLRALTSTVAGQSRYPRFARLSVALEEMTTYAGTRLMVQYDASVRLAKAREMFSRFEEHGIEVDVSVRKVDAKM